jgi:hypothetical protein
MKIIPLEKVYVVLTKKSNEVKMMPDMTEKQAEFAHGYIAAITDILFHTEEVDLVE